METIEGQRCGAMAVNTAVAMELEGPEVDEEGRDQAYRVCSFEGNVRFWVIPETGSGGMPGWAVRIEGVPGPSIVHDEPWPTPDAAKEAALKAIGSILELERMQREDRERGGVRVSEEPCEDPAG
jgi:hypothetical protein